MSELLRNLVFEVVLQSILRGDFKPGQPISREQVFELIARNRIVAKRQLDAPPLMSIREAFVRLEHEGLVDIRPQLGTFVRVLSAEEAIEIQEARRILEENVACKLATMRNVSLDQISKINSRMRRIAEKQKRGDKDIMAFAELDDEFHRALAEAAGYPTTIARFLGDLRKRLRLVVLPSARSFAGDTVREHDDILAAVQRQASATEIKEAIDTHLTRAMHRWESRFGL